MMLSVHFRSLLCRLGFIIIIREFPLLCSMCLFPLFPPANRPKYGGRYCLGERKRFRICNIKPCPPNKPSFRQVQCSQFNPMPYKGKLYKWTPVPNNSECAQPTARLLLQPSWRA